MMMTMLLLLMMIMSTGRGYVSEMRPLRDLLFIPEVKYERGKILWNDIDRGKLISPPELYGNRTSRVIS
jgi:hypothetical protein